MVSLIISDVPGDDPSVIASGPTVPDATTLADARAVLKRYGIDPPPSVQARLADPNAETPKPGDPVFARTVTRIIAAPQASLEAAALVARKAGVKPLILGDSIEGEAAEVGRVMAGIARQVARAPSAGAAALRVDLRRRNDGDRARPWARRAQRRVSARRWPSN